MLGSRRQLSGVVRALLGVCTSVCLLTAPQLATAGTYQVVACDDASAYGYKNNSWTSSNSDQTTSTTIGALGSSCQPSGSGTYSGLGSYDIIGSGAWSAVDSAWTFTAPSGTTITNASINRYIGKYGDEDWRPYGKFDGVARDTCDYDLFTAVECSNSGTFSGDYGDSTIAYGYSCDDGGGCAIGATRHRVYSFIYSATITLSESVAPSLSVSSSDFSGGESLTGTQNVSFAGSDTRGIRKAELYVDGMLKTTATNSLCDYTFVNPCADPSGASTTWNSSVSYDTSNLSDGTHTAYVRIYDAADNTTDSDLWSFTTDNTPNTGSETGGGSGSGDTTGGGSDSETGGGSGTDTGTGSSTDTTDGAGSSGSTTGTGTESSSGSTGTDTTTATKSSTNLKIKNAKLENGRLTVKGTCARHTYAKRFRLTYDPTRGETVRRRFKCIKGRWSVTLTLSRRVASGRLTVRYPGDKKVAKASVSRRVRS